MSSGVEFDEDKFSYKPPTAARAPEPPQGYGHVTPAGRVSPLAQWLIDHGIVKSEGAAEALLIGFVLVNIIITYIIIRYFL